MSLLPVQVVPLSVLFLGLAVLAQPHPALASPPVRSLELPPLRGVAEVRVAPGLPTTLLFNAKLDRGAVERAGRGLGLARVGVTEDMLVVVPAQEAKPGARLTLPIRFAGEEPHEEAAVVFVVDPPRAEASVRVIAVKVPSALRTIVQRALRPRPEDRYPSAAAMRDELRAFLAKHPPYGGRELVADLRHLIATATGHRRDFEASREPIPAELRRKGAQRH